MTDTPPDWVLIEAAKRSYWPKDVTNLTQMRASYTASGGYRALCDMIQKYEQPPVDRKLLCAREAARDAASGREGLTDVELAIRAIELWEEGFGK